MSKTMNHVAIKDEQRVAVASPLYRNPRIEEELRREDEEAKEAAARQQNPKDTSDHNTGDSATQKNTATSDDQNQESTYEKRWKDLKKHYDTEVSALRNQIRELQESKESFTPPKTAEELETFRKQNPEFYDVMLSLTYENNKKFSDPHVSRIQELESKLLEVEQEKAFKEIEKAHPDYLEVVSTNQFTEWLENQDKVIRSWLEENSTDASKFIRALDLYKLDNGLVKTPAKRKEKANSNTNVGSAADAVPTSGAAAPGDVSKRIWSRTEITRMSDAEFEKNEPEIMQAMLEGRVR